MEQKILSQVQARLDELKSLKQQVEDTKKQISEKDCEISDFIQEWKSNCKHVFYRVQGISIGHYTKGYHCCLCGTFVEPSETPDFIGTVISNIYGKKPNRYPIPPEYQAEVDSKKEHFDKLIAEGKSLSKKLNALEKAVKASEEALRKTAHLLMSYFDYPTVKVEEPHHWGPDDFNYDPFE